MDYTARFYSPVLNRFIQPDSIVPGMFNPQNLNRFSYVGNNPINFNDPTGHCGSSITVTGIMNGTSGTGGVCLGQNSGNSGGSLNGLVINSSKSPITISDIAPNISTTNTNNQSTSGSTNPFAGASAGSGGTSTPSDVSSIIQSGAGVAQDIQLLAYLSTALRHAQNGVNYGLSDSWLGNVLGLKGRYYTPSTINQAILKNFKGGYGISLVTALIGNIADYQWGPNSDKGVLSQEFAVSTLVDLIVGVAVVAGAAFVVGAFVTVSTPALVVAGAVILVGVAANMTLNYFQIPDKIKNYTNNQIDIWEGEHP
ncbi:MAG: hypothetical protein JNJ43_18025 [Anaerolineales bacterium]|nr:hypothetical protein [Anaerolineales bacterium]